VSPERRLTAVLALLVLLPAISDGQSYSLNFSRRSNRMTWRPTFPSWNLRAPVSLAAASDSTAMMRFNASASMNAILDQRNGRNNWTENASVRTSILYPVLGPRASIGINANMSVRNASLLNQKTRNQTVSFRFQYKPLASGGSRFKELRFDVVPGVITARRASPVNPDSTIEESGLRYSASMNVSPAFDVKGERLSTSMSASKTDNTLKSNKNRNESVRMSASYNLPGDVRASTSVSESRSQLGVTRAVVDSTAGIADTLVAAEISERRSTNVNSSMTFEVFGFNINGSQGWRQSVNTNTANEDDDPRNRFFGRDRETENWDFKSSVKGRLPAGVLGSLTTNFSTTDERRRSVRLSTGSLFRDPTDDREETSLLLRGSLDWQILDHTLTWSSSARMIRIDNPGDPTQDRDSYNGFVTLGFRGTRESGLRYDLSLSSSSTQRTNLDATRSAENQENRDLRLSANTSYERVETTISHNFEISARRTIFDFDEDVGSSLADRRSNIRRGWSMRHTFRRRVFEDLRLNGSYAFSIDDFGTLLVENGTQIVEEDNTDHRFTFGMSYRPDPRLSLGTSFNYRLDRRWDYTYFGGGTDRDLSSRNTHRNLVTSLEYLPDGYTGVKARFSRSKQRSGTFDDLTITLSRTL
jgi:hypothetical protein